MGLLCSPFRASCTKIQRRSRFSRRTPTCVTDKRCRLINRLKLCFVAGNAFPKTPTHTPFYTVIISRRHFAATLWAICWHSFCLIILEILSKKFPILPWVKRGMLIGARFVAILREAFTRWKLRELGIQTPKCVSFLRWTGLGQVWDYTWLHLLTFKHT